MARENGLELSGSLASEWDAPEQSAFWPLSALHAIQPMPTAWVTVSEYSVTGTDSRRTASALIPADQAGDVLDEECLSPSELGAVELFGDGEFHDGLRTARKGLQAEYFCGVRQQMGEPRPLTEPSLPFLWYWRAIRDGDNWRYIDDAGRDVELIRTAVVSNDDYKVEVNAMALRDYLHTRNRLLLIDSGLDVIHPMPLQGDRIDVPHRSDWASFDWIVVPDPADPDRSIASLDGHYLIFPADSAPGPYWLRRPRVAPDVQFVVAIDPATGTSIRMRQEAAGNDSNPGPEFFRNIIFRPEVLSRYTAIPSRYAVTASSLTCLTLWRMDIGHNSDGQVEVMFGDLDNLPRSEWSHWAEHSMAPTGARRDEAKLRRDIFNQSVASPDPVMEIKTAKHALDQAVSRREGRTLFQDLREPARTQFAGLHPPTSHDQSSLSGPVLILTQALVDAIAVQTPRRALAVEPPPDTKSLALLELYIEQLGGDKALVKPFRDLQAFRSRGGIAHYAGSSAPTAWVEAGIAGMTPTEAFINLCARLTQAMRAMRDIVVANTESTNASGV